MRRARYDGVGAGLRQDEAGAFLRVLNIDSGVELLVEVVGHGENRVAVQVEDGVTLFGATDADGEVIAVAPKAEYVAGLAVAIQCFLQGALRFVGDLQHDASLMPNLCRVRQTMSSSTFKL